MSITATKKKKDGLTQYRVRVSYKDADGKFRVKERTAYGLQEAKKLEQDLSAEPFASPVTLRDLSEKYVASRVGQIKRNTEITTDVNLRLHILPYVGDMKLAKLSPSAMQDWKNTIAASGLSVKSQKRAYNVLCGLLNFGVKLEYLPKNPLAPLGNFRAPAVVEEKIRYYTPEQVRTFLSAAPHDSFADRRYYTFYLLALYTGCRCGELFALKWSDLEGDIIHVRRSVTRGGKYQHETSPKSAASVRDIRIPSVLVEYLKNWRTESEAMPGFSEDWRITATTDPLVAATLRKRLDHIFRDTGLPRITIHEFRHTHASFLVNAGVNIKEISRRLGHSSVEVTWSVYAHLYPNQEEVCVAALERFV